MPDFEQSIIELSKHKLKLLNEVQRINQQIEFLRKQQEEYDRDTSKFECS